MHLAQHYFPKNIMKSGNFELIIYYNHQNQSQKYNHFHTKTRVKTRPICDSTCTLTHKCLCKFKNLVLNVSN